MQVVAGGKVLYGQCRGNVTPAAVARSAHGGRLGEIEETGPFRYYVSIEIAMFGSKAHPSVSQKILSLVECGRLVSSDPNATFLPSSK